MFLYLKTIVLYLNPSYNCMILVPVFHILRDKLLSEHATVWTPIRHFSVGPDDRRTDEPPDDSSSSYYMQACTHLSGEHLGLTCWNTETSHGNNIPAFFPSDTNTNTFLFSALESEWLDGFSSYLTCNKVSLECYKCSNAIELLVTSRLVIFSNLYLLL